MLYLALPLILTSLGFHSNYSNEPSSTHTQTEIAIYRHSYIDFCGLKVYSIAYSQAEEKGILYKLKMHMKAPSLAKNKIKYMNKIKHTHTHLPHVFSLGAKGSMSARHMFFSNAMLQNRVKGLCWFIAGILDTCVKH